MVISDLMRRAFSTCMVIGDKVQFIENFSKEEIVAIYDKFSKDLLDYNIPHYRVVGIYYMNSGSTNTVLRSHTGYSMSIIELGEVVRDIIPDRIGGNDKSAGCVLSTREVAAMREEGTEPYNIGIPHCLEIRSDKIGQLMYNHEEVSDMHQSDLLFMQYYLGDGTDDVEIGKPEYLLDDFLISKTRIVGESNSTVFFYLKSKGIMDYEDTARLFTRESDIFPCRTIYDLSNIFMVKYPTDETNCISLILRRNINGRVLEKILREYGGTFNGDSTETD